MLNRLLHHGALRRFALSSLIAVSTSGAAAALTPPMIHPNLARGDGNVFHRFPFDRVNMFNGNLRVDIPLGRDYPLATSFSYRLVLRYNSNAWDLGTELNGAIVGAEPMPESNAGLGWDLSLGRLIAPSATGLWVYVSPDGAPHPFYDRLHPDEPASSVVSDVFYSRDGTYLRLRLTAPDTAVVDLPDGKQKTFTFFSAANAWKLTSIADPYGNGVTLTYSATEITVTDSVGRTQRIVLRSDPSGLYPELVDHVELTAFGGATATYSFAYATAAVSRPDVDNDPATAARVLVPWLESLTQPDGSLYTFAYDGPGGANGRMTSMVLPTLGRVQWAYGTRWFQATGCAGGLPPVLESNVQVVSRTTLGADGETEGTWSLPSGASKGTAASPSCDPFLVADVVTPLGDRHRYYFDVDMLTPGWKEHYGEPVRLDSPYSNGALSETIYDCALDGTDCRSLRSVYREIDQDTAADGTAFDGTQRNRRQAGEWTVFPDDPLPGSGYHVATLQRDDFDGLGHYRHETTGGNFGAADHLERFWLYDAAQGSYPGTAWSKPAATAPWVLDTMTQQRTTDGTSTNVIDYCYDEQTGYLWRKRLRLSASAPDPHDVIVTYPRDAGNVAEEQYYGGDLQTVGTQAGLCDVPLTGLPPEYRIALSYAHGVHNGSWYLRPDGTSMGFKTMDLDIDSDTGLPSARRDVAGMQTDLTYDAMGRPLWEKPQAGGGAWIQHSYTKATGADVSQAQRDTRVEASNDGTQILGRTVQILDGFARPWVHQEQIDSTKMGDHTLLYDAMGWVTAETEGRTPSGQGLADGNRKEYRDYDALGRPAELVHADGSIEFFTYYGNRRVVHTVSRGYYWTYASGVVQLPETTEIVKDRQGRVWQMKDTHYSDQHWDGPPVTTVTQYDHDLAGNVTAEIEDGVNQVRRQYDGAGNLVQEDRALLPGIRRLVWDFGDHDPRALPHAQTVTRFSLPTVVDATQQVVLRYDAAGRLLTVQDSTGAYNWRQYVYGAANATTPTGETDWRKGHLLSAVRNTILRNQNPPSYWHNWGNVTEEYEYSGVGGRVSRLSTSILGNEYFTSSSYSQTYTYDDKGRVTHWALASAQGEPGYAIDTQYDLQAPKSTAGTNHLGQSEPWLVAESLGGDGGASTIEYGNGVVESIADDGTPLSRPGSITLDGLQKWDAASSAWVTYQWTSGEFEYDGRGSNTRRGEDYLVPGDWEIPAFYQESDREHPCWQYYADPYDLNLMGWSNEYCALRLPLWLLDDDGRPVATYDADPQTTIRDLAGNVVWRRLPAHRTASGQVESGTTYVVSIYADGGSGTRIGEVRRTVWDNGYWPDEVAYRFYPRGTSVILDADGVVVNGQ